MTRFVERVVKRALLLLTSMVFSPYQELCTPSDGIRTVTGTAAVVAAAVAAKTDFEGVKSVDLRCAETMHAPYVLLNSEISGVPCKASGIP